VRSAKYVYYALFSMVLLGTVQQTLEGSGRKRYTIPQRKSLKRQSLPPKPKYKQQQRMKEQRERIKKEREEQREVDLEELHNKLVDLNEEHKEQYQEQQRQEQQRFMAQEDWQEQLQEENKQLYERLSEKNYQETLQSIVTKQEEIREELKLPIIFTDFCAQPFDENIAYH